MTEAYFEGLVLGLAISVSFGPVFFALIETSISHGPRTAMFLAFGVLLSDAIFISVSYFASAVLVATLNQSPWLTLIAAGFFIFLGLQKLLFSKNKLQAKAIETHPLGFIQHFLKGMFLNGINPALLVFWTAIAGIYRLKYPDATLIFFAGVLTTTFTADIIKSFFAGKLHVLISAEHLNIILRISGMVFLICGCFILLDFFGVPLKSIFGLQSLFLFQIPVIKT